MTDNKGTFDLDVAHRAVEKDIAGVLGSFLDGKFTTNLLDRVGSAAFLAAEQRA